VITGPATAVVVGTVGAAVCAVVGEGDCVVVGEVEVEGFVVELLGEVADVVETFEAFRPE
jgi:hypothetical protein